MARLETPRLILRDYTPDDLAFHHQLLSDPQAMEYLPDLRSDSLESSRADLQRTLEDLVCPQRQFYFFVITLKESGTPLGTIGYTVTDRTPQGDLVHLGYFSLPAYWRRGYTAEALAQLVDFAFAQGNVWRMTTGCLESNAASERVMQKCGFVQEARRPDWQWLGGKFHTRVEYRLLRSEWQLHKSRPENIESRHPIL